MIKIDDINKTKDVATKKTGSAAGFFLMAGVTGLGPATFCVTGRRSNQLSYTPLSRFSYNEQKI